MAKASVLEKRRSSLSAEKQRLLKQRLGGTRAAEQPSGLKVQRSADEAAMVSFSQQRLWFLDKLQPESPLYNLPAALRVEGSLDIPVLAKSINEILCRHEILRTSFEMENGKPSQVVGAHHELSLPITDLTPLSEKEQRVEVAQLIAQDARTPFDLAKAPLLRVGLLKLSTDMHVLLINMHHIISDGWSMGILIREIATLYRAFAAGEPSPLPALPIQFADFAAWQRDWLQGDILAAQLSYWKRQMANAPAQLELPTDRPRPPVQTVNGCTQRFKVDAAITGELERLGQRSGCSLFMILYAVFATLLGRYSGQTDIVIGTPVANRNRPELEPMIGFFVNNLMLRADLSGDPSFSTLLDRVRRVTLEASAHQDVPFEQLVEILRPDRTLSHAPLFQVMIDFQNDPVADLKIPGLTVATLEPETVTARFDLTLSITQTHEGLRCALEYNTDLFDADRMTRMTNHFRTLLSAVTADPDQRLSHLSMLTETEQRALVVDWNRTETDYPRDKCFHELFEAQVNRSPDRVAVCYGEHRLTYGELNLRANQLARHLRSLGVGPEAAVAVFADRSLDMLIGLLGVMKAGGAYVPLDPSYPKERIAYMLEDAAVPVVLTQDGLTAELPALTAKCVCLDADWQTIRAAAPENLDNLCRPDNLAYIIYTSGSTGKPKGVQIPHKGLVNFLNAMGVKPGLTDRDVVLAVTTISFDIAALELYLPLIAGGRVVIVSREAASNGSQLLTALEQSEATVMQGTPATWRLLLDTGWQGSAHLNIFCGGEALPRELADQLLVKGNHVWNLYGPTETTIWSTVCEVKPERPASYQEAPESIGRPIDNTEVYILDPQLRPLPVGVPGELFIGGDGLARGYRNRPGLTAEKFIPDPFSGRPGARLYRVGDLARYRADGTIEFLGRVDHQVKIRGFRIELGEIEAVLSQHSGIRENVVISREDVPGDHRLVAYLVLQEESTLNTSELRRFLQAKLPDYMVPSSFEVMTALPLTPNGKVNRRALPAPAGHRPELEAAFVEPQTATEAFIADVWSNALQLEKVGIHDNFFDLGGYSLLLVQVHNQLQSEFGPGVSMVDMFQYPTIHALAQYISQGDGNRTPASPGRKRESLRNAGRASRSRKRKLRQAHRGIQPE